VSRDRLRAGGDEGRVAEGVGAVVPGREGVVGRQQGAPVRGRGGEVDRADVAGRGVVVPIQGGDGDAEGGRGRGGGRGAHDEVQPGDRRVHRHRRRGAEGVAGCIGRRHGLGAGGVQRDGAGEVVDPRVAGGEGVIGGQDGRGVGAGEVRGAAVVRRRVAIRVNGLERDAECRAGRRRRWGGDGVAAGSGRT